jgi:lysophospholipase L1-like esterase
MIPRSDVMKQGVRITINSDGFRDRDFSQAVEKNEFVIAVLGDSYTFAQGVSQDSTYPAILERILNEDSQKDLFRVWNLGVSGYNTEQESYLLASFVLPRKPRWVVVGYNINDYEPVNVPRTDPQASTGEQFREGAGLRGAVDLDLFVISFARYKIGNLIRMIRPDWYRSSYVDDVRRAYSDPTGEWQKVSEHLRSMNEKCKKNGVGFTVALLPAMFDFSRYEFADVHAIVLQYLLGHGIDAVDVAPYFSGNSASQFHVSLTDPHPNAQAQNIFARVIADHLLKIWGFSARRG